MESKHDVCSRADEALRNNQRRMSLSEMARRSGMNRSTYYNGIKHGTLKLVDFWNMAKTGGLSDEQLLEIFRSM